MKKKKRIAIIHIIIILIITCIICFNSIKKINSKYIISPSPDIGTSYTISCYDNYVTINFMNSNGIKSIEYPAGTIIISPNGKTNVSIDYKVEKNKQYIFRLTDENNNISYPSFSAPGTHIELIKHNVNVDLNSAKNAITTQLQASKVATNFISIGIGEQGYVNTQTQDMGSIFNSWGSFGDGHWSYDSSTKIISNSFNSTQFTGYYYPNGNYTDIDFAFDAMTTDADDDFIGAMTRFSTSNLYTSYLLILDRHDNGRFRWC